MSNSYYVDRFEAYCPQVDMTPDEIAVHNQNNPNSDPYSSEDISSVSFTSPNKNLIVSLIKNYGIHQNNSDALTHAPVIDIDVPCELIPSSRLGHYHLYIHHPIRWKDYKTILYALSTAGIVEEGYYNASASRGYTAVRAPGVVKPGIKVTNASIIQQNAILRRKLYLAESELASQVEKINLLVSKLSEFIDGNEIEKLLEGISENSKIKPEPYLIGSGSPSLSV